MWIVINLQFDPFASFQFLLRGSLDSYNLLYSEENGSVVLVEGKRCSPYVLTLAGIKGTHSASSILALTGQFPPPWVYAQGHPFDKAVMTHRNIQAKIPKRTRYDGRQLEGE